MATDDPVALAEIEMYGELMIAAAATSGERLTAERIDTILRVERGDDLGDDLAGDAPRVPQQRVSEEDDPPPGG